jgi:large subunit ribosomal protein L9
MKVVFLESVPGARTGEVKDVKNGYARNYLLPRGMALPATREAIERAQARSRAEERRQASLDGDAQKLAASVTAEPITLRARVGETGRLYGSITANDIAEALSARAGSEIDRRTVELGEPIRQVGEHTVHIRFTRNVGADVQVNVEAEADEE